MANTPSRRSVGGVLPRTHHFATASVPSLAAIPEDSEDADPIPPEHQVFPASCFLPAYLRQEPAMRPSESHPNLSNLGHSRLPADRSSASTPDPMHRSLSSGMIQSRPSSTIRMTPSQLPPPHITDSSEYANMPTTASVVHPQKDDDDVFGADDRPRSNILSSFGQIPSSTNIEKESQPSHSQTSIVPRLDRLDQTLTADNAQGILPPVGCVFVANLATERSDKELESSCTDAFKKYGECYVKVHRDRHSHPFAIVQYSTKEQALAAIEGSKDLFIDGRKIRTEKGNAHRSVILTRIGGGMIAREEAQELLNQYGPIEEMTPTTHRDQLRFGIGEGMRVQFAYVADSKDALKEFHLDRANAAYKLISAPESEQRSGPPLRSARSTTDQKSIFVGNLPDDAEEQEIRDIFEPFGKIEDCNVIRKPIAGGIGRNVFAFIEFENINQAEAAARQTDVNIRGQRIRVEPKEYSARRHTRLGLGRSPAFSHHSPRGRGLTPSYNTPQLAQSMPGGFFPLFTQTPYGEFVPLHPAMYSFDATPPSSSYRPGIQSGYMHRGAPHQVGPFMPSGYARRDNNNIMQADPDYHQQGAAGIPTRPHHQQRWR